MNGKLACTLSIGALLTFSAPVHACYYHWLMGMPEPTGVWPTDPNAAASQIQAQDAADDQAISNAVLSTDASPNISPSISPDVSPASPLDVPSIDATETSWIINTNGATGRSTNATINNAIKSIPANVQQVRYTSTDVYVEVTGIPDYNIGPFGNDPNIPANTNATFDINRNPTPKTGTKTATGLGAIGVLINGVAVFNPWDGTSYQNLNVWHPNAGVAEAQSFDTALAHPQQKGVYHNHENPVSLLSEIGATSTTIDSPVIGYAIDGYPILGDYSSLTPGGAVVKMTSGYKLKAYAGGVRGNGGPAVSAQYPLGYFEEDYQYDSTVGNLDQYNGAFVYTPQYPNGTYAYFATTDSTVAPAYPYFVGTDYNGVVSTDDLPGATVTVPADSTLYVVPEPTTWLAGLFGAMLMLRRSHRIAGTRLCRSN